MKNVSHVINGAVAISAIIISVLFLSSCKDGAGTTSAGSGTSATSAGEFSGATLPIAYINIDSILVNYEYAKDVHERLTRKQEDIRGTLNQKGVNLEKEGAEFQRKMQNNAFLSTERAEQEYNRLQKQQQELEQSAQRFQNEFASEQMKENMQIADSVRAIVKLYNVGGKFELILNMRELENIILANPQYDITQPILDLLNSRYKPEVKK